MLACDVMYEYCFKSYFLSDFMNFWMMLMKKLMIKENEMFIG